MGWRECGKWRGRRKASAVLFVSRALSVLGPCPGQSPGSLGPLRSSWGRPRPGHSLCKDVLALGQRKPIPSSPGREVMRCPRAISQPAKPFVFSSSLTPVHKAPHPRPQPGCLRSRPVRPRFHRSLSAWRPDRPLSPKVLPIYSGPLNTPATLRASLGGEPCSPPEDTPLR